MGYSFPINSKGSFICTIPHTTAFVILVVEHWLEREIAQWVHPMKDRSDNPSHHERTLLQYNEYKTAKNSKHMTDSTIQNNYNTRNVT